MKLLFLVITLLFVNAALAAGIYGIYPVIDTFSPPTTVDNVCLSSDGTRFETKNPVRVCSTQIFKQLACRFGEVEVCRVLKPNQKPRGIEYLKIESVCTHFAFSKLASVSRLHWVTECGVNDANLEIVGRGESAYLHCKLLTQRLATWPINYPYTVLQFNGELPSGSIPNAILSIPTCLESNGQMSKL